MAIDTGLLFKIKADGSQAKAEARETANAVKRAFDRDPFGDMRAHLDDMKRRLALLKAGAVDAARGVGTLDDNAKRSSGRGGGVGQFIEALAQGDPGELLGEIAQQGGKAGVAVAGVTLAAGAAAFAVGAMTKALIENIKEVDKLARDYKLAAVQVQALQVYANLTGESVEDLAENYGKLGPEIKKIEQLIRESGAAIDNDLRKKVQDAARAWEAMKIEATGALNTIGKELLPVVTVALQDMGSFIRELNPAFKSAAADAADFFVDVIVYAREAKYEVSKLASGISKIFVPDSNVDTFGGVIDKWKSGASEIGDALKGNVEGIRAEVEARIKKLREEAAKAGGARGVPSFNRGKAGKKGREDISESELQIRLLRAEQDEAQRGLNGTREAAERLFDITQKLIEAERKQAEGLKPNESIAKLAELRQKQLESAQKYSEALSKANDSLLAPIEDISKRINQQNIEMAKAIEEADAYVREQYQLETDAYQRRAELQKAFQFTFIANRRKALADLAALEIDAEERRFERMREEAERELALMEETDERRQAIIDRLAAQEAEKDARVKLIRRQSILDQQRAQPNSNLNVLGPNINDALNGLNATNAALGKQTTFWEQLRVAMKAYAEDLKATLPSTLQLATQSLQNMGAAITSSVEAFATGQASIRQAVGSIVTAMLEPYKKYAQIKASLHFAEAAGHFVYGNFALGAKHTAIGVLWSGLAGLIGSAGALIGGGGGNATASAAGGSSSAQPANAGPRVINQDTKPQTVQIILRVEEGIIAQKVVNDYKNNGVTRQMIRSDVGAN